MIGGMLPDKVNTKQLTMIMGISHQRLNQLVRDGLPRSTDKLYVLADAIQWMLHMLKTTKTRGEDKITEQRIRKLTSETERLDMDNAQRRQDLIHKDDVLSTLETVAMILISRLEALAPRLASQLSIESDPQIITSLIDYETREIRTDIADKLCSLADYRKDSQSDSAA